MSEKTKESLSVFMKKQISEKSSKKTLAKKLNAAAAKNLQAGQEKEKDGASLEDEMTDEEKLEEAKKASRNKAAGQDQTEMLKKLFMENCAKYLLMISMLVVLSIGVIKFGPAMVGALNGLVTKMILGSFGK